MHLAQELDDGAELRFAERLGQRGESLSARALELRRGQRETFRGRRRGAAGFFQTQIEGIGDGNQGIDRW